jgi:hypothetical protein
MTIYGVKNRRQVFFPSGRSKIALQQNTRAIVFPLFTCLFTKENDRLCKRQFLIFIITRLSLFSLSHYASSSFKIPLMKWLFLFLLIVSTSSLFAQKDSLPTLKSILLEQLKTTHNAKDWFVPPVLAVQGLTAEQANWKDSSENHSIAQLTTHLIFWNKQLLDKFKGDKPDAFNGDNKETFSPVTDASWTITVKQLDDILSEWERVVAEADDKKLTKWYSTIAHIGTHNAYHTGQILYIRKMKGWWDDSNGVK